MIKLLGYYGFCSLKNQIRKLFKTWFAIFLLVCIVLGVVVGFLAAKIDEKNSQPDPAAVESEIEIQDEIPSIEELSLNPFDGIEKLQLLEVATGGAILLIFLLCLLTAGEKGYCIFLPADVSTLFTSPMTPPMALMFRVFCQMGLYIFFTIYFMIEIPMLKDLFELSTFGAASVILCYGFSLMLATFSRIYLSLFTSIHKLFGKYWTYVLYCLLALVAALFIGFWKSGELNAVQAAVTFFNLKWFVYFPVLGWLKGIVVYSASGNIIGFSICLLLTILSAVVLLYLIKNIKADFYEEAMKKSEEVAAATAKIQEKGSLFAKGKKSEKQTKKQEKLKSNNLNYGWGASEIFVKSLYNRFRFAIFGVLTKTMITYTFVCVLAGLLARHSDLGMFIPAVIVAAFVFFRSMGNPLREDTDNLYFLMAPAKSWLKLMFSALAGCVNCLLDIIPGFVIAGILLKTPPLEILGWMMFIVTMDFFSTCTGAFVNISLPQNAGATVKQIMQIMFLYIGLLPDALVIVLGLVHDRSVGSTIMWASLVNIIVGLVFFSLTVSFIQPRSGICRFSGDPSMDIRPARKKFSSAGFAVLTAYALTMVIQLAVIRICQADNPDFALQGISVYLLSFLPMYCVGIPVALLILRGRRGRADAQNKSVTKAEDQSTILKKNTIQTDVPVGRISKRPPRKQTISLVRYVKFIPVMSLLMLAGSLVGTLLSLLFSTLAGEEFVNPVVSILDGQGLVTQIIFVVIIGPLVEELFFRKALIDSMNVYGERVAIIVSAVFFGLFHGNVSQFSYTVLLGLLLGYVYERSGNILYSYGLHMMLNFFNGIVPTYIISNIDFDALDAIETLADMMSSETGKSLTALGVYYIVFIVLAVVGLVILLCEFRNLRFERAPMELPQEKRFKVAFLNPGMICFVAFMITLIVDGYVGFLPF